MVRKRLNQKNHCSTNKKSPPKKPHFCHYCGASGHTCPNCYKWLSTQKSNSVSSLGNQNQLQLPLVPLGELFKAVMLHSNFNGFNFHPYPSGQKFMQKKGSYPSLLSGRKKILSDFFSFLISCMDCVVV